MGKIAIAIALFLLISSFQMNGNDYGISKVNDAISNEKTIHNITEDQKQEKDDGKFRIYGNHWYAQSFRCNRDVLTGISIKVGKNTKDVKEKKVKAVPWLSRFVGKLFFKKRWNDMGNLVISIYSGKNPYDGKLLRRKSIPPEKINESNEWLTFDFRNNSIENASGKNFTIVCHADGGNFLNCYIWRYGRDNPYPYGAAFVSEDGGNTWINEGDKDFCFISYGKNYSDVDESPDGVTRKWALLVYWNDADTIVARDSKTSVIKMASVLEIRGDFNIIAVRGTKDGYKDAWDKLDKMEDSDDIVFLMYAGHTKNVFVDMINELGSGRIVLVYDCCYAQRIGNMVRKGGREILMSCKLDELAGGGGGLHEEFFSYFLREAMTTKSVDASHDGWISAEEAFSYAKEKTEEYSDDKQHPVMYDDYPGEIPLVKTF